MAVDGVNGSMVHALSDDDGKNLPNEKSRYLCKHRGIIVNYALLK